MNIHTSDAKRSKPKQSDKLSISFDVFDTFLVRACATPDGVLERAFQVSSLHLQFPNAAASFVEHRRQAEARARSVTAHATGSSEVGIADIYRYFPYRLFGLTPSAAQRLIDAEFAAELDLCRVNPDIFDRYGELRRAGGYTGFISDTYWSADQLGALLRHCSPDLQWDFLFASSQNGTSKSEGLFRLYLKKRTLDPRNAVHIGDNPGADIASARRHAITALHVPQASAGLAAVLTREAAAGRILCPATSHQLDGGMRTLRRLTASRATKTTPAFRLGHSVLGPVMQAFEAFVHARVARLTDAGKDVRVAFLGRDGFLSHRLWSASGQQSAAYLEVNRRVSMMASAKTLKPIIDLVKEIPAIDADTFADITKLRSPRVNAYFAKRPSGRCHGRELAKALPHLLDPQEIARRAGELRGELMQYLRGQITDLDRCSDLVLVDLGYSGSIQKALRRVFDIEGIKTRIHGLYLLTLDDGFVECAPDDTFEGLISDLVVTPHVKRCLLRNIAVLEQMCSAPTGSVRAYQSGTVIHETNALTVEQQTLAREVQGGVLAYADTARDLMTRLKIAPFADLGSAAGIAAATLGRFLLLPTDEELVLLSQVQHDVNLGTTALTPLLDAELLAAQQVTRALPDACTASDPPMWLAGSFAALSPVQSFHYLLFGANLLSGDIFGDVRCGEIDVTLHKRDGSTTTAPTACYRVGTGELRVRIPMSKAMALGAVTLPIARLAPEGFVSGPFLQFGDRIDEALRNSDIAQLGDCKISATGMTWNAGHYADATEDASLTIGLPVQTAPVAVLSLGIAPMRGARALALD